MHLLYISIFILVSIETFESMDRRRDRSDTENSDSEQPEESENETEKQDDYATENEQETTQNNDTSHNETNEVSEDNEDSDETEEEEDDDADDSQSVGNKTAISNSQVAASQASIVIGSGRQSTDLKSQIDLEGAEQTEIDMSKLDTSRIKKGKISKIQSYFNYKSEPIYTLSAKAFTQFEDMIFTLMKVDAKNNLNPDDPDLNSITKLTDFDKPEFTSAFVPDMKILNQQVDFSIRSKPRLKALAKQNDLHKGELKDSIKSKSENQEIQHERIVTIIANSSNRPRKIVRILLNKQNTTSFDQIKADICNTLKMEYGTIRKFFSLRGIEISQPLEFFKHENVFLAVGTEKIFNKDFELDQDEGFMVFADELIKPIPDFKMLKIANKFLNKKSVAKTESKEKQQLKFSITPFDTNPEKLPEDLLENYQVGEIIGEGNFATVRECVDINTGIKFALKIIDLRKCKGKEYMIENELKILRKVKHPNIIKLVEEYSSEHKFYLIMELLKNGDLLDAITSTSKYTERDAAVMIFNLASAVSHLHSLNIAHRDIKLENILIHKHADGGKTLKLGDFGLAIEIKEPINQICGSPIYIAPEILMGKYYGLEVDIWSLGVIAYILLCGFAPFRGDTEQDAFKSIKTDNLEFLSPYWDNVSNEAKDLIQKMLTKDQKKRIKAHEVLLHPWLNEDQNNEPTPTPREEEFASNSKNNLRSVEFVKPKSKNLHDEISKNLSESFRRSSRDPAITLVTTTALDKYNMNVVKTPTLDKVDENNEDI